MSSCGKEDMIERFPEGASMIKMMDEDNGYGDKQQDTYCNRIDIAAGLSYHMTLCNRLELYARAMVDAGLRWYFCNKAGLWVEGGHDAGYVSAGLSFKF